MYKLYDTHLRQEFMALHCIVCVGLAFSSSKVVKINKERKKKIKKSKRIILNGELVL